MKTIAYCGGTFDLLHVGHIRLFHVVKRDFDILVVSVNTDEFNERYKGRKSVIPIHQRIEMLRALRDVDEVIVNYGDEDSRPAILSVMPTAIVHGSDMSRDYLMKQMNLTEAFLRDYRIDLIIYPYTSEISTTQICEKLK